MERERKCQLISDSDKKKYGKRAELISLYVIEHSEGRGDGAGNG